MRSLTRKRLGLLAIAGRVNLPITVFVTLYSNPLTIVPLYYMAFRLGQLALLQSGGELPPLALDLHGTGFREWIPATLAWLGSAGKPLVIGLPLLALLLALAGYCLVDWSWRLYVRCTWAARSRGPGSGKTGEGVVIGRSAGRGAVGRSRRVCPR